MSILNFVRKHLGIPMKFEIDAFVDCIESGKKLPSNIDSNILTSQMMDAIYRSAELHEEVKL